MAAVAPHTVSPTSSKNQMGRSMPAIGHRSSRKVVGVEELREGDVQDGVHLAGVGLQPGSTGEHRHVRHDEGVAGDGGEVVELTDDRHVLGVEADLLPCLAPGRVGQVFAGVLAAAGEAHLPAMHPQGGRSAGQDHPRLPVGLIERSQHGRGPDPPAPREGIDGPGPAPRSRSGRRRAGSRVPQRGPRARGPAPRSRHPLASGCAARLPHERARPRSRHGGHGHGSVEAGTIHGRTLPAEHPTPAADGGPSSRGRWQ